MPPYRVLRDFLDAKTRATLLEFSCANEAKFEPTLLRGSKHDPTFRVSLGLADFKPEKTALRERIRKIIPQLIAELGVNPFTCSKVELELVAHGDGAFFKRHLDTQRGVYGPGKSTRMISAVYYFHAEPKAFSGGALRLYRFGGGGGDEDGFVEIEPEQNTLLAFPSWAAHEVLPVSCPSRRFSNSRFAVNCWLHR